MPSSDESTSLAYPGAGVNPSACSLNAHYIVQSWPLSSPKTFSPPAEETPYLLSSHSQFLSPHQSLATTHLLSDSVALGIHLSVLTCVCSSLPTVATSIGLLSVSRHPKLLPAPGPLSLLFPVPEMPSLCLSTGLASPSPPSGVLIPVPPVAAIALFIPSFHRQS